MAPETHVSGLGAPEATESIPEPTRRAPYQPALFTTRDLGRIVPIEAYKQRAAERRERARQAESVTASGRYGASGPLQPDLPFPPSAPSVAARSLAEARYSKAPVAIPVHRLMAAAIDFGMVIVVAGILCAIVLFSLEPGHQPRQPLLWFAGSAVVLAGLYKLLWASLEMDSPGLRWCHLKLLHFDGRTPTRRERTLRIAWSMMSIMAGGLGLVWSLVDEESLSWHDHSSKTFLTPHSSHRPS